MKRTKLPLIFSIAGALGVIATGALASFATVKAVKILEADGSRIEDHELNKETAEKVWKNYILPGSVALLTITSILAANRVNKKMLVTLAGALIPLSESYKRYREEVMDADPELDKKITKKMAAEHYISPWGDDMGEKVWFYDSISDRCFQRSWYEVKDALYHFNRNFQLRGFSWLNELYEFLGLDPVAEGNTNGFYADWFYENGVMPWIDYGFSDEKHDGKLYNNLYFTWPPVDLNGVDDYGFCSYSDPEYWISPC